VEHRFNIVPQKVKETKQATRRLEKMAAEADSVFIKKLEEEPLLGNCEFAIGVFVPPFDGPGVQTKHCSVMLRHFLQPPLI
jgi:hypothetical protein